MLHSTFHAINAVLKIDPTISHLERAWIMRRLEEKDVPAVVGPPTKPRLLRRQEVADRLGCSLRTVDKLAAQGVLERVCLPGRVRASGFREGDLSVLLTGEAVSKSLPKENAGTAGGNGVRKAGHLVAGPGRHPEICGLDGCASGCDASDSEGSG